MGELTTNSTGRVVDQQAFTQVPEGLLVRATAPGDVPYLTALMRRTELAGCGTPMTNDAELVSWLDDPQVGWARGAAIVWRAGDAVGSLIVEDALVEGGGWTMDVVADPADDLQRTLYDVLIEAGLRHGQQRWDVLDERPGNAPIARAAAFANDAVLRDALEGRGFAEVRRYWQMRIDHPPGGRQTTRAQPSDQAAGYRIRVAQDTDEQLRALYELDARAFAEHFDFEPTDFETWAARMRQGTEDPALWLVAERDDQLAGFALGSNRYASEGYGYVGTLAVDRPHRGQGLARALLLARFAADAQSGMRGTLLDVDSQNTTGAVGLYQSVGMVASAEYVGFHRALLASD